MEEKFQSLNSYIKVEPVEDRRIRRKGWTKDRFLLPNFVRAWPLVFREYIIELTIFSFDFHLLRRWASPRPSTNVQFALSMRTVNIGLGWYHKDALDFW